MQSIISRIASDLALDEGYINKIIERSEYYYKDFSIKKKDGGVRFIAQASPELKTLQYWAIHNFLCHFPISKAAMAYQKGDSIKKHAQIHSKSTYILHTDIHQFFPSIRPSHLLGIIKDNNDILVRNGLEFNDTYEIISKICFRKNSLCIGTVSSPIIANIILYNFDIDMIKICDNRALIYTRYADDIYITSKKYIEPSILVKTTQQLNKLGFTINGSKTSFHSKKYRRKITGLIITNSNKISVGLNMRKKIKKMIYNKLIHDIGDDKIILGYLAYLKDIEPLTYNNLIIKYSSYCNGDLINSLKKANANNKNSEDLPAPVMI